MKLAQRIETLERGRGSPVRIAGWLDSHGEPYEPAAELRQHVEEQAALLWAERCEWGYAVIVDQDTTRPFVVLFEGLKRDAPLLVVELP